MKRGLDIGVVVTSGTDGGGEAYLRRLYGGLAYRGHRPVLIGRVPGWNLPQVETAGTDKWDRAGAWRHARTARRQRAELLQRLRDAAAQRGGFDLLHLQYKREQLLLTSVLSRIAPVLWTEHGRLPHGGLAFTGLRLAYRAASRKAAGVVCVSDEVARDVCAVGVRRTAVEVIPNAVDTDVFLPPTPDERRLARERLGVPATGLVLVTASRLHYDKGIDRAIDALDHLPAGTALIVAGDGPFRPQLEARAADRAVTFTGHVQEMREVLVAGDVFLILSRPGAREGAPLSLLEAAACGLGCVTARGSGVEATVTASGGALADPDPQAIARAVLGLSHDAGSRALRWADAHGPGIWLDRHERVMTTLAESRSTR